MSDFVSSDMASHDDIASSPVMSSESFSRANEITESEEYVQQSLDAVETVNGIDNIMSVGPDLFILFATVTVILGCLTAYYLWKFLRKCITLIHLGSNVTSIATLFSLALSSPGYFN